jgi:predicted short-subunit dehydrogenase-like oxidoreductase (DUF2520 family)
VFLVITLSKMGKLKGRLLLKKKRNCGKVRASGIRRKLHQMIMCRHCKNGQPVSGGDDMQIGIVGAGRVGCSMGKYLVEHGQTVAGYFSKSKESAETAAIFTDTRVFSSLEELVTACDVLWITTPDDAIAPVWDSIQKLSIQGKMICHFSGSLSSVVYSDRNKKGVTACSIHPMYAFSNKFTSYQQLHAAVFTMEGDAEALAIMKPLFEKFGNRVCVIAPEQKIRYHAAATTASNLMIGLYQLSAGMLEDCGFAPDMARELLKPLVRGNITKLLDSSPEEALTGPVERADVKTVQKHLEVLNEEERILYKVLSRKLVETAERKNPEKDYSEIENILELEDMGGMTN